MKKEEWIEEVLAVAGSVSATEARASLFTGIKMRIGKPPVVSTTIIWLAAASFALLITVNVMVVAQAGTKQSSTSEVNAYSFTESHFNLY